MPILRKIFALLLYITLSVPSNAEGPAQNPAAAPPQSAAPAPVEAQTALPQNVIQPPAAKPLSAAEALDQAEKLYQSGEWEKSRQAYKALLATENSATLPAAFFYNLGTASGKSGAWGESYVALLRAAFDMPFDSDVRANLREVENSVPAAVRAVRPAEWYAWWPSQLRFWPWQAWAIAGLLASALMLILRRNSRSSAWVACAMLSLFFLFGSALTWLQTHVAVAGALEIAKIKSGPGSTFSDITTLEPGSLVSKEATRGGWLKIRFLREGSEIVGWVEPKSMLEVIKD